MRETKYRHRNRVTTKFKIGKKSGKSLEFDFQTKSREKVLNFVVNLEKVLNFSHIAKLQILTLKNTNAEKISSLKFLKFGRAPRAQK